MTAVLLATRNAHKLREVRRIIAAAGGGVEVEPLPEGVEQPPETGETYAENALIKARAAAQATGRAAFADDSGIEAEALGGRPGVRTARYAGPHATDAENLARFVEEVRPGSALRYVCVIAHVEPDGSEQLFAGACTGRMAPAPAGSGGFGYDPIFVPDGDDRTMAELPDSEKDAISHRGEAVRRWLAWRLEAADALSAG